MEWYKIPEIRFRDFIECLRGVYLARDASVATTVDDRDPFTKACVPYSAEHEAFRQREKNVSMKFGYFHQNLMGKFHGYKSLKNGDVTGIDLVKEDGTEAWEIKNRHNTMNSGSAKTVENKLLKMVEKGVKAFVVQVNCPNGKVNRHAMPAVITVFTGQQAYAYLSKRDGFWDDLISTVSETFARFKTLEEVEQFAAQLPEQA